MNIVSSGFGIVCLCSQLLMAVPVSLGQRNMEMFVTSLPAHKERQATLGEDIVDPDAKGHYRDGQGFVLLLIGLELELGQNNYAGHRVGHMEAEQQLVMEEEPSESHMGDEMAEKSRQNRCAS